MADSELLLQPEMLAELKRYRALEHRLQVSRQQCQEFKELARQIAPGNSISLPTPLRDGSPAAELGAALSALEQQIETMYEIEAQLNEELRVPRRSTRSDRLSLPSQMQLPRIETNIKIALYVIGGFALCVLILTLLHIVMH
jgi:hypothetical protein